MIQFLIRCSCLWVALLGALVPWRLALAQAESALSVKGGAVAAYDPSREITVQGTIEEVDLGPAAMPGKSAFTPGQAVDVVGVMADASGGPCCWRAS